MQVQDRVSDVRALVIAHLGPTLTQQGLDPEEFLQELWRSIMARQAGPNPYDPKRAAFSTWVLQVARGVLGHHRNRVFRWRDTERLSPADRPVDSTEGTYTDEPIRQRRLVTQLAYRLTRPDREVLPYLLAGHSAAATSVALQRTHRQCLEAYARIRAEARKLVAN